MKTQSEIIAEVRRDIQMTVRRGRYMYAGELAGWLDHAAKRLLKVDDVDVVIELFKKIVFRTLKLLRSVDDSNASLQSVLWEGGHCFEVWNRICRDSDESALRAVMKKIFEKDEDFLAEGLFFPESELPIREDVLRKLIAYFLADRRPGPRRADERILEGCLGWYAQLKDEKGFNELVKVAKIPSCMYWRRKFILYLNLERYDEAITVAKRENANNPRYVMELMLQVAERSGDRDLLMRTALQIAKNRPSLEGYKRLSALLSDGERSSFVSAMVQRALKREGFDTPFCEVLFAAGEIHALHSYAVARYAEIFSVGFCTGMIPLAKKLFKAGDPLAACILMRGAIYYLMNKGNPKYYEDVHRHRAVLAQMALTVKDWETVESQEKFDADFKSDFASRRSFWI